MLLARIPRLRVAAITLTAFALIAGTFFALRLIDRGARQTAYSEAREKGADDAAILAAGLQAELDKFSLVPLVLADDSEVRDALTAGSRRAPALDRRFETLAKQTSAAAIYLMNTNGLTIAASNWRLPTSFVGSNYSFRRYFRDAMAQGGATQFALGTVSGKPGLYIAQRVEANGRPAGIVAVKVEFDSLEANWRKAGEGVFVTDREGVVLITSRDAWRFRTTRPEAAALRDRVLDRRQFGITELEPLSFANPRTGRRPVAAALLDANQPINFSGWRLHLLLDPAEDAEAAIDRARLYALLAIVAAAAVAALALVLKRRREARAQRDIERKTQELREQLGQANRLAMLGQVTAGIGHEINQPVAAVRIFAESGGKLLEAGRGDEARTNFKQIVGLTDRIGRITDELRRFSRRQSGDRRILAIGEAVEGAVLLLRDRIVSEGVELSLPGEEDKLVEVVAEHVRLEQVLVNLLQNAFDAVAANPVGDRRVSIALTVNKGHARLSVRDNGPGLTSAQVERLFQPFATDKPKGLGLGLVISKDIMRELGGDLEFEDGEVTAFTMTIPRAT